jgi:hypothetical protein
MHRFILQCSKKSQLKTSLAYHHLERRWRDANEGTGGKPNRVQKNVSKFRCGEPASQIWRAVSILSNRVKVAITRP